MIVSMAGDRVRPAAWPVLGRWMSMDLRRAVPHPKLRNIVRSFEERRATLGSHVLAFPLTARPHQILDIYLGGSIAPSPRWRTPRDRAGDGRRRAAGIAPDSPLCFGAVAYLQHSAAAGSSAPAGRNRNDMPDQRRCPGMRCARQPRPAPRRCRTIGAGLSSRVAAAERWFAAMLEGRAAEDGIAATSRRLMSARGNIRIAALAEQSGLSARQFQRRFTTQTGLPPKLYARAARFDAALTMHRNQPAKPWHARAVNRALSRSACAIFIGSDPCTRSPWLLHTASTLSS